MRRSTMEHQIERIVTDEASAALTLEQLLLQGEPMVGVKTRQVS